MSGYVYYVTTASAELVKIGYTNGWPEVRLKGLQTGSPHELCIIATERGDSSLERQRHERFGAYRVHGEWFERCPEMDLHIRELNDMAFAEAERVGQRPPKWVRMWHAMANGASIEEADRA